MVPGGTARLRSSTAVWPEKRLATPSSVSASFIRSWRWRDREARSVAPGEGYGRLAGFDSAWTPNGCLRRASGGDRRASGTDRVSRRGAVGREHVLDAPGED